LDSSTQYAAAAPDRLCGGLRLAATWLSLDKEGLLEDNVSEGNGA